MIIPGSESVLSGNGIRHGTDLLNGAAVHSSARSPFPCVQPPRWLTPCSCRGDLQNSMCYPSTPLGMRPEMTTDLHHTPEAAPVTLPGHLENDYH
jgi:hypothetical protein